VARPTRDVFDRDFLHKLEKLEILARKIFRGHLRGEHATRRLGRGMEFADYRQYQPGDDFRHIDWNIFSRLDRLFLRLFTAADDLSLHLLLDTSSSMALGEPPKFDYARKVAAALGFIGLSHLDRVTVTPFADALSSGPGVLRTKQHTARLFEFLQTLPCAGSTRMAASVNEFCRRSRGVGLVVLISDFLGEDAPLKALDTLRHRGHDVMSVQLLAEQDIEPPVDGPTLIVDSEDGTGLSASVDDHLRRAYVRRLRARLDSLEQHSRRHGLEYLRATTVIPFDDLILNYLRRGALFR